MIPIFDFWIQEKLDKKQIGVIPNFEDVDWNGYGVIYLKVMPGNLDLIKRETEIKRKWREIIKNGYVSLIDSHIGFGFTFCTHGQMYICTD